MDKCIEFLKNILIKEDNILLSCSGGPDSMCLLKLLIDIRKEIGFKIIVAHVNHGVRDESSEEEVFVRDYCALNDISFELLKIESYKGNFHNDARVIRYNFLDKLYKEYNCTKMFTAHHGDDLVETILMRISRGSNLTGYIGFKNINKLNDKEVIRPLIYTTKKDIIIYNDTNNIPYRIDESNNSLEYTRNKFRHLVLPNLKKIDENIHLKFLKFSEKLNEYDKFIESYIDDHGLIEDKCIMIKKYNNESDFIKTRVIEKLISLVQLDNEFYVTDNIILEIIKIINSQKGRCFINLPNGFIGKKENHKFYIEKSL